MQGSFMHLKDPYERAAYGYQCLKKFESHDQYQISRYLSHIPEGSSEVEKYEEFINRYCYFAYFEYLLDYLDEIIYKKTIDAPSVESKKLFMSWSGEQSKQIAKLFVEELKKGFGSIETYFTPEDLMHGKRWGGELAEELEKTKYGILILTKQNHLKPWINFEAGAISKNYKNSMVWPICFDFSKSELEVPLSLFQAADFNKEEFKKMLKEIVELINGLDINFDTNYEMFWNGLESKIKSIPMAEGREKERGKTLKYFLDECEEKANEYLVPINECLARGVKLFYPPLEYLSWTKALMSFLENEKYVFKPSADVKDQLTLGTITSLTEVSLDLSSLRRLLAELTPKFEFYSKTPTYETSAKEDWGIINERAKNVLKKILKLIESLEKEHQRISEVS